MVYSTPFRDDDDDDDAYYYYYGISPFNGFMVCLDGEKSVFLTMGFI
jgi:hypothetical protein